jgi:hypothetical protein
MLKTFWANAPATLSTASIDTVSMVNQVVQTFLAGSGNLWISLTEIGVNLTNIRNARGGYLTMLAKGFYDIDRTKASPAVGIVTVARVGTISNGTTLTLQNALTGIQYTGTWNAGTSATSAIGFTASRNGPNGNANLAELASTSTSLFTVDSSNPTGKAWVTAEGADDEADGHLIQRCLDIIASKSSGGVASIASQIRIATSGNVWRVFAPRNSALIYVAGLSGPANASYQSTCLLTASKYTRASVTPTIIGCSVPIATQTVSIGGSLLFAPGTPQSVTGAVVQGLKDWFDTLPICSGETQDALTLAMILRKIFELDPTDKVIPQIFVSTAGWTLTRPVDVLPQVVGAIMVGDIASLQVVYQ